MKNLVAIIFILVSGMVYSQSNVNAEVGDKAFDFTSQTIDGKKINLKKLYKKGPVVLVVLRGWPGYQCPICTRQVGGLVAEAEKFEESGASVLMVYPGPAEQLQEHANKFSEDFKFPANFSFTLDPDYSVINKYGLRWDAPKETAYPSTFVINKKGEIVFSKVSTTHGGRTSNEEIFEALDSLDSVK